MKQEFKKWLINQNSQYINDCGIETILSRVDDELSILQIATEEERIQLLEWLDQFIDNLTI
ncbi:MULTISPECIES: hypothetical protein [Actinobacillus]|nr:MULTISPECIES: hypothetical protein [Actinobacillus]MDE8035884.1 hypothetical protein [Actinobacillus equuli subsp. equuli]MDG4948436.1 hypothetical protein [Actinobacillus equuli subsp. haemolyticus]MEE3682404.1 hypothetical protein [Actinobacillus pleuropneumoniae]UKH19877.1 hypothetical protein D1109_01350 [Actinobacillus pleuropneumoniae]UKH32375.1 hypothetical protein D1103_02610 [Actinobacillus pleuropneumoniae serovar 10 str. D13039]